MSLLKELKKQAGFTFIEVLIAVSIIGILTTIGLSTYSAAQKKSRDSKRKADLEAIRSALEMYYTDNDSYPTTGNLSNVVPNYIQSLPSPPPRTEICGSSNSLTSYAGSSAYTSGGSTYSICVGMEAETDYTVRNP